MPEVKKPAPDLGLPIQAINRAPNQREISRWKRLLLEHSRASNAVDAAALLLQNIYTAWTFAIDNSILLPAFDPSLEEKFFDVQDSFEKSKAAIRGVSDHKLGIRLSGTNDLDIVEPSNTGFGSLVIPVIIGIVVVGSAIATAIWQSSVATKLANEYRRLLFDVNSIFCKDEKSEMCKKWKQYRKEKKYEQNIKISDSLSTTIKKGVTTVAGSLATGLILAIVLIVANRSK